MRPSRRTESQPTRRIVRFAAGSLLLLLWFAFSTSAAAASATASVGIRITWWPVGPAQQQATVVTGTEMLAAVAETAGANLPAAERGAPEATSAAAESATLSAIPAGREPAEPDGRALVLLSWE
jgi:hypothetical protein